MRRGLGVLAVQVSSVHHRMVVRSDVWQVLLLGAALLLLAQGVRQSLRQHTDPWRVTSAGAGWTVPWSLVLGVVALAGFVAVVAV